MFSKPTAIVFLRRNNMIVAGKHIRSVKLNFIPEVISNMELLKADRFTTIAEELFTDRGIRGKRVLMVLDQTIVFSKTLELEDPTKDSITAALEDFVALMPFEPGQRACLATRQDNQVHLYATNADLYQAAVEALRRSGMRKLIAVTPAAAYAIDYNAKPSKLIEQFMEDKTVRQTADFSTTNPY